MQPFTIQPVIIISAYHTEINNKRINKKNKFLMNGTPTIMKNINKINKYFKTKKKYNH